MIDRLPPPVMLCWPRPRGVLMGMSGAVVRAACNYDVSYARQLWCYFTPIQ